MARKLHTFRVSQDMKHYRILTFGDCLGQNHITILPRLHYVKYARIQENTGQGKNPYSSVSYAMLVTKQ